MPRTHSMEIIRRIAALTLTAWLFGAGAAWSAEVRGWDTGLHGQIELEWDQPPEYRIRPDGNRVIVVFDRQIGDGAPQAFRRVGSYIEEGRVIGDGSTILLVLNPSVSLVDRQVDGMVVLELRPPAAAAIHAAPSERPVPMTVLDLPALDLSAAP